MGTFGKGKTGNGRRGPKQYFPFSFWTSQFVSSSLLCHVSISYCPESCFLQLLSVVLLILSKNSKLVFAKHCALWWFVIYREEGVYYKDYAPTNEGPES